MFSAKEKSRMARWQEAKWAIQDAAYFEYLPDYKPGWIVYGAISSKKLYPNPLTKPEIIAHWKAGVQGIVFYKPGIFPSPLDRERGMGRYQHWVEVVLRGGKFLTPDDFNSWLMDWSLRVRQMVDDCHTFGIKVLFSNSDAFNIGGHVYNTSWFDPKIPIASWLDPKIPGGKGTLLVADLGKPALPDGWVTQIAKLDDPDTYRHLPEHDLIAPHHPSADYVEYCRISAENLIADFDIDGFYYDDNAEDSALLQATAEVAHRHGRIVMLHHSKDNMTAAQFQTADYWLTGENFYSPTTDRPWASKYDFLKRRQTLNTLQPQTDAPKGTRPARMSAGFLYGVSLSKDYWGGKPNNFNTAEPVGFGFLMCGLKFPVLYPIPSFPAVPDGENENGDRLWMRYLPLYKEMVKPDTVTYVCVTESSFVKATKDQFLPLVTTNPPIKPTDPPLFYNVFVNDHIYLLFTNNATTEAHVTLTHKFKDMLTKTILTEAIIPGKSILMLVKL